MKGEYETDRRWADKLVMAQKRILAPVVGLFSLDIATFQEDTERATDMTTLRSPTLNIGMRVRRSDYVNMFGLFDFTFRSRRASGAVTELAKIYNGHGTWFLYSHADRDDSSLPHWMVIDLNQWRKYKKPGRYYENKDGTTFFRAFRITEYPVGCLIAASQSILDALPPLYSFASMRRLTGKWSPSKGMIPFLLYCVLATAITSIGLL